MTVYMGSRTSVAFESTPFGGAWVTITDMSTGRVIDEYEISTRQATAARSEEE